MEERKVYASYRVLLDESEANSLLSCLGIIALFAMVPVLIIITVLVYGITISMLWSWFVIPTFNLPPLPILAAYGMSLILYLIVPASKADDEKHEDWPLWRKLLFPIGKLFAKPLWVLVIGWVVHQFV